MKLITRLIYALHRALGTVLSLVFLMWFLTGFVMIHHGFPRITQAQRMEKQQPIASGQSPATLLPIDTLLAQLPTGTPITRLSLQRDRGHAWLTVTAGPNSLQLTADTIGPAKQKADKEPPSAEAILQTASQWCQAPITRIDTLHKLDQWIPFGQLKKELPIYKFHFADHHQLYISSQSGQALQLTTRRQRAWAYVGAIPHWVYFTRLRQDLDLWKKVVIWLSGVGCVMVITGLYVGIHVWRKTARRRKGGFSPYRKPWYHWHYVGGIVFGLFALTFAFSGMMSLADIPSWVSQPRLDLNPRAAQSAHAPSPPDYPLDYRLALSAYPEAKQVEWQHFGPHPYYLITGDNLTAYVDAAGQDPQPLNLSAAEAQAMVQTLYQALPDSTQAMPRLTTTQMEHFDLYYRHSRRRAGQSQLPVWKINSDDADHTTFYVNPATADLSIVNTTRRWEYWCYQALHTLRIGPLNTHDTLRQILLYILLIGGTLLSTTGVVLAVRYLIRLCRPHRHPRTK